VVCLFRPLLVKPCLQKHQKEFGIVQANAQKNNCRKTRRTGRRVAESLWRAKSGLLKRLAKKFPEKLACQRGDGTFGEQGLARRKLQCILGVRGAEREIKEGLSVSRRVHSVNSGFLLKVTEPKIQIYHEIKGDKGDSLNR